MCAMRTRPFHRALWAPIRSTSGRSTSARFTGSLAATLLLGGLLAGCSGGDDEPQGADNSTAASEAESSAEPEPYLPVPEGTELTEQGQALELGDTATVAYQAAKQKIGVLDLTVTRIDKAKIKDLVDFKLDKKYQKATPYYVHARVKNVGETNLVGTVPPLYVEDGQERLVQASQFRSVFKPCPSTGLPKGFRKDSQTTSCWVYLVTGKAKGASFYPVDGFVPIEWSGEFTQPGKKKNG